MVFDSYPFGLLGVAETLVGLVLLVWLMIILELSGALVVVTRLITGLILGVLLQLWMGWDWVEFGHRAFMTAAVVVIVVPVEKCLPKFIRQKLCRTEEPKN